MGETMSKGSEMTASGNEPSPVRRALRLVLDEADGYNVVLSPSDEYEGAHFTLIGLGDRQADLGHAIVRAVNQHDALLKCAEALRAVRIHAATHPRSVSTAVYEQVKEALSLLEKTNG